MREKTGTIWIVQDDMPAIYEIGVTEGNQLKVSAHQNFIDYVNQITTDHPYKSQQTIEAYNFPPFSLLDESDWGYGGVMKGVEDKRKDWLSWQGKFLRVGDGPEGGKHDSLVASLEYLFSLGQIYEGGSGYHLPQLVDIDLMVNLGRLKGSGLRVRLARSVMPFFGKYQEMQRIPEIEQVVKQTFIQMRGKRWGSQTWSNEYRGGVMNKGLHLQCPGLGYATVLGISGMDVPDIETEGGKLTCDNVDDSVQQLSLLMGVAKFHDMARQAGF